MGSLITIVEEPQETRDLSYNVWSRTIEGGEGVDVDFVPMCRKCQKPIAFLELVRDTGNNRVGIYNKCSLVTDYIAMLTHRPSFVVFYFPGSNNDTILSVKVKQTRPKQKPVIVEMTADTWAEYLRYLQRDHRVICKKQRKGAIPEDAKRIRTKMKEQYESNEIPERYDEEEVILLSGQVADEFMAGLFLTPRGEIEEDRYDEIRNKAVEVMEREMREWRGMAYAPLPVELVSRMRKAAWQVIREEQAAKALPSVIELLQNAE